MKYYCLGIKGAGMSTLANILYDLGNDVEGYDDETNTSSGILWKCINADFVRQKNQKFKDLLLSHLLQ